VNGECELLFTARPNRKIPEKIAGVPVTRVGEIVRGKQMKLVSADGANTVLKPAGLGALRLILCHQQATWHQWLEP
jgi:hypothetical protein